MFDRDPGSTPQTNDRIPYVFVETTKKNPLMGDRIEHVEYVKRMGLRVDTKTYIESQIQKPCVQLLAIALEKLPGYRFNADADMKALPALLEAKNGNAKKARERLDTLREREVEKLIFEPVLNADVFKERDNRCANQRSITAFFPKKKPRAVE